MKEYYYLRYNYDYENAQCNNIFNSLNNDFLEFNYKNRNGQVQKSRIKTIGVFYNYTMYDLISGKIVSDNMDGYLPGITYRSSRKISEKDFKKIANDLNKLSDEEILTYIKLMSILESYMKARYEDYKRNLNRIESFESKCLRLRRK